MTRTRSAYSALVAIMLSPMAANAVPITYDVNRTIGSGSVVGSIVTDGTVGVLSDANILDWAFTLTSPNLRGGSPDAISLTGTGVTLVVGAGLSATVSDLIFDFTGTDFGLAFVGFSDNAWCMASGPLDCVGEPTPSEGIYFGTSSLWAELRHPTSAEIIATAATAVPEPTTLSLLGAGLIGFGLMRRRRRVA